MWVSVCRIEASSTGQRASSGHLPEGWQQDNDQAVSMGESQGALWPARNWAEASGHAERGCWGQLRTLGHICPATLYSSSAPLPRGVAGTTGSASFFMF